MTKKATPIFFSVEIPNVDVTDIRVENDVLQVAERWRDAESWSEQVQLDGKAFLAKQEMVRSLLGRRGLTHLEFDELETLFSLRIATRALPVEALPEFLQADELRAVKAFVQRYGALPRQTETESDTPGFALSDFHRERHTLFRLIRLWTQVTGDDPIDPKLLAGLDFGADPQKALSFELSRRLVPARSWLVAREGRLDSVLFCLDIITALHGLFLKSVIAGSPWKVCPRCDTLFPARGIKVYCGPICQDAAKSQRRRDRKKGGKNQPPVKAKKKQRSTERAKKT